VNSVLYEMKNEGAVQVSASKEWSVKGRARARTSATTAPAQPARNAMVDGLTLTDEQQDIAQMSMEGHLLVRGQAGSGKTTVLAARAGTILSATSRGTLLFLTYNAALCAYVRTCFAKAGFRKDIDVRTFHDWSKTTATALTERKFRWVSSKERVEVLERLIKDAAAEGPNHRFFDLEAEGRLQWWSDEIAWIFGQGFTTLDAYKGPSVSGAARRPASVPTTGTPCGTSSSGMPSGWRTRRPRTTTTPPA
jgi:hypothetical protein